MKKTGWKILRIFAAVSLTFALVACSSGKAPQSGAQEALSGSGVVSAAKSGQDSSAKLPTFAIVASDTIGDRGFVDMSNEGLEKASKEFGVDYKLFSCNNDSSIYLDTLKTAAENYDVIFVVPGYFFDVELAQVAELYPDKTFIYVDGTTDIDGVVSCTFSQNEGAFLAGVVAANLTQDTSVDMINGQKKVGFLGGADMPTIHDYEVGFTQGVEYADSSVEAVVRYTGDHYDPEGGKVTAYNMYQEGVDVIFQAAGPTGLGVLEAAATYHFIAIGVDTDQGYLQPNYIATSMLKRVDTAVYDVVKKMCSGEALENVMTYNVANGGISLADNEYYQKMVPQEIRDKVAEASKKIASGEIKVNSYL